MAGHAERSLRLVDSTYGQFVNWSAYFSSLRGLSITISTSTRPSTKPTSCCQCHCRARTSHGGPFASDRQQLFERLFRKTLARARTRAGRWSPQQLLRPSVAIFSSGIPAAHWWACPKRLESEATCRRLVRTRPRFAAANGRKLEPRHIAAGSPVSEQWQRRKRAAPRRTNEP